MKRLYAGAIISVLCVLFISVAIYKAIMSLKPGPHSGVLIVLTDTGQGSCFVVAKRGDYWYAITANHVVAAEKFAQDITVDDEAYETEIVRQYAEEDIAVIRFKSPEKYKIYSFARAELGEPCTAVGWSRGSILAYKGHVTSLDYGGYIVANGGVVPGCSGGVLLNKDDEIIGVTVAIAVYYYSPLDSTALYVPARFAEAMYITIIGDRH